MTAIDAALLGLVQGLTEFLPVSSTAHLLLAQALLGLDLPGLHLEVAVHLGTLASVLLYYRADLWAMTRGVFRGGDGRRLLVLGVLGTLPAVVVGLLLKDAVEDLRENPRIAAAGLIAVGLFLLLTRLARRVAAREPGARDALIIGSAQAVSAIVPGVSRSGSTIGTGMFLGLDPAWAARFSFLLSVPAILGAAALDAMGNALPAPSDVPALAIAAAVAFATGLAAIHVLLRVVARGRLAIFGVYCVVVGVAASVWLAVR